MKMKSILSLCVLTVSAFGFVTDPLHAQVPNLLNYQGRVAVGGVSFSGAGSFKFALVDSSGASTFWSNDGTSTAGSQPTNAVSLTVTSGLYSVLLGDTSLANMTAVPPTVFANSDVRLRVWFNDGTNSFQLLTPDQRLAAVGYAMTAATLQSGVDISAGTVTASAFVGDGSGVTGLTGPNLQQIALLKWGVSTADNTFSAGSAPSGVCFDGANIWVVSAGGSVTKFNAATGTVVSSYNVGSIIPYGICFDGASIWFTSLNNNTVTKLNASTGVIIGAYSVGSSPKSLCFDGTNVWVANFLDNNVTKLNASTGAIVGTYNVGLHPSAICFDGISIWTANTTDHTVTKLNASNGVVIGTYSVGLVPLGVCFDGANIWVANDGDSTVTKLSASTGTVIGTYGLGTGIHPGPICFDGTNIWVANENSTLVKLTAGTGTVMGTFAFAGSDPIGLCFDGASIWLTDQTSNTLTKY